MIWLVGNNGMLGQELSGLLAARGYDCVGTDREVDITSIDSLSAFAAGLAESGRKIDWIVNCAAYTAVDKAEDDRDLCRALNTAGAANLAATARSAGARFFHISTDYVFHGDSPRPYREDDPTDPIGVYGLTKRDGELAARSACPDTWIVRTAWLYGRHGNNFVHTMLKLMSDRERLSVVDDQHGTPTRATDLCMAIETIIAANGKIAPGIYHFSNGGETTWYEFAREIYRLGREFGVLVTDCEVVPCTSAEFPAKVTRPLYSVLDKTKIETAFGHAVPGWQDSLRDYLKEYTCAH